MAIRPVDIRRKEFKSGFRGYDANQVDDFLDEVADEFERTFSENQRMSEEITSLQERLQQFEELEASIREALVHAQQVSQDLRRNAGKEAELIVREAKEQAHRILADSSGRVERVQESYEALRKAKQEFSNDFRYLLKTYLAVMDNADVTSAREIEASLRERLDLESVAAAREAADTRRSEGREEPVDSLRSEGRGEPATQATGPLAEFDSMDATQRTGPPAASTGEDSRETQRIEAASTPTAGRSDATTEHVPGPEAEEPEVYPSSAQGTADQQSVSRDAADASTGPDITREVEHEEPMPAGEGRTADEFFDEDRTQTDETEERKIFRASRFLRRRG